MTKILQGGCHCGAVRFQVQAELPLTLLDCNCSICIKLGYLHLIAGNENFQLLSDEDTLSEYRFNTSTARHLFCTTCGVKSFYVPRSHPDGVSVNARCLDDWPNIKTKVLPYDGRNWSAARKGLG